jgi:hypothetical protein
MDGGLNGGGGLSGRSGLIESIKSTESTATAVGTDWRNL